MHGCAQVMRMVTLGWQGCGAHDVYIFGDIVAFIVLHVELGALWRADILLIRFQCIGLG